MEGKNQESGGSGGFVSSSDEAAAKTASTKTGDDNGVAFSSNQSSPAIWDGVYPGGGGGFIQAQTQQQPMYYDNDNNCTPNPMMPMPPPPPPPPPLILQTKKFKHTVFPPTINITGRKMCLGLGQFQPTTQRNGGSHQTNSRLSATTTHSASATTNPSPQTSVAVATSSSTTSNNSHLTWEEAVSAPILPIRCKDTNAQLYKAKFGSGNKGKCIKTSGNNEWLTPTEFEGFCGRAHSKDWKRSIRFGGSTLQKLIDLGFLTLHAISCNCSNCEDDVTATGPIKPFTPYRRKWKSQSGEPMTTIKRGKLTSKDSNTEESPEVGTPGTPPHIVGLDPLLLQALVKDNQQMSLPACTQDAWKVLEDGVDRLVSAATALKSLIQEMKERTIQETEELRSQLQQNSIQIQTITMVQQNPADVGHPQILRIFDSSNQTQTYTIEQVLGLGNFEPIMQAPNSSSIPKCDNCGREEGKFECTDCHAVHYCSSFCENKDWPTHQAACQNRRGGPPQLKKE